MQHVGLPFSFQKILCKSNIDELELLAAATLLVQLRSNNAYINSMEHAQCESTEPSIRHRPAPDSKKSVTLDRQIKMKYNVNYKEIDEK
jgi:hypothetical protein